MRHRILTLFLSLTSLVGCQHSNGTATFPYTDDKDNAYMTRNGDNYGKSGLSHSYESLCRPFSRERLEDELSNGRATFFFVYKDFCHSCESAHNDLVNFFLSSLIEVEGIHFTSENEKELLAELALFRKAHPLIAETITSTLLTPSIFLIKNEEKTLNLQFMDQRDSLQNLYDFFKGMMNFTMVYTFHSFDSFSRFYHDNDCLVYVDEVGEEAPTPFYEAVYPLAIHSPKITAHIEINEASKEDTDRFLNLLPEKAYVTKKGELSPIPLGSIANYYA